MSKISSKVVFFASMAISISLILSACTEVLADTFPSHDTVIGDKITPSLSAAQFEQPVCFARQDENYDGVVSLHKDRTGNVIGKTFGVKKLADEENFLPFEQSLKGRYLNNNKIKMNVKTNVGESTIRQSNTLLIKGQTLSFAKRRYQAGDCKLLVNNFLNRDIKRRRLAEKASRRAL